jgi:trehalose 6-phosphate synthase/phosphatase
VGDDWTDEDLFKVLPPHAFSIKVGFVTTAAKHNINSHLEVRALLQDLERK